MDKVNFTVYPHLNQFERIMLQQDADEYGVDITTICTEIIKEHIDKSMANSHNWSKKYSKEDYEEALIRHKHWITKHTKMVKFCEAGIKRFERKEARNAKKP